MSKSCLILALLVGLALQDSIYNQNILTDPDAKCLDGSPGSYYVSEGSGVNKTKFVVYFEGGGWCGAGDLATTLESCYQRSRTDLGSSKAYPKSYNLAGWGLLAGEANVNHLYYDWTRIYIKYCTGTGHQGTKSASVSYKGTELWFRGHNVTIAILDSLQKSYGIFNEGTEILVSGCSAGGLAAYTWANYIYSRAKGRVITAPDSGLFLDSQNVAQKDYAYRNSFINFMKISNVEIDPPIPECVKDNPNEKWRCMFAQYQFPYIRTPLFPVNSLYDSWSIPNILGIHCESSASLKGCTTQERAVLEAYRKNTSDILTAMVASDSRNGAWGVACSDHCYMHYAPWNNANFEVPTKSGFTIQTSLEAWMKNERGNNKHIDTVSWPDNGACAGATVNQLLLG
jgi:hypothetical protein